MVEGGSEIIVYGVDGKENMRSFFGYDNKQFSVSNWANSLYLVCLYENNNIITKSKFYKK